MDWGQLGKQIASTGATLLGSAIAGPAGAGLGAIVAEALGVDSTDPSEISQAIERDPMAAVKLREIQSTERVKLREIQSAQVLAEIAASTEQQKTVNETMRAELTACDPYRARWRPTFGYVMAANMATISVAFFAAVAAVIVDPASAGAISTGFSDMLGAFVTIFSLGLGVLGIQVHQRSKDKRAAAGIRETSLLERLGSSVKGSR